MKKLFSSIALFLFFGGICFAQNTTTTATITDSDGTAWANATWRVDFVPSPSEPNENLYTNNGAAVSQSVLHQTGTANGSGAISMTLYRNTSTNPSGSSWRLTLCPTASVSCQSYSFVTSTSSLSLSSALTASLSPPRFLAIPGSFGYADIEAIPQNQGATYWNVTTPTQKFWNGSAWITISSGKNPCTTTVNALQLNNAGNFGCSLAVDDGTTLKYTGTGIGIYLAGQYYAKLSGSSDAGGGGLSGYGALSIVPDNGTAAINFTSASDILTVTGNYNPNTGKGTSLKFQGGAWGGGNIGGDITLQPGHDTGGDGILNLVNSSGVSTLRIGTNAIITPGFYYSAAGTPLPTCSSSTLGRAAVSDATVATPGSAYTSGGTYTIGVQCIFHSVGSVYSWIID